MKERSSGAGWGIIVKTALGQKMYDPGSAAMFSILLLLGTNVPENQIKKYANSRLPSTSI